MNTAVDLTSSILMDDYANKKANEAIKTRFFDVTEFIADSDGSETPVLKEYDKHFKAMMNQEQGASDEAHNFMLEQAKKMINKELGVIK